MKSRTWLSTVTLALLFLATTISMAQTAPVRSKEAAIRELLEISGAGKLGIQVMNQMIPALKQAIPDGSDEFWDRFMSKVNPNDLVDLVIPIYEKHLSLEELETVITFYKTPIGKKVLSEMPTIMNECMVAGQNWGMQIGERAIKELTAEKSKK